MPIAGLRMKFVLVLLFGAILPLALVGVWLVRSTERSGERLLRSRLDRTLAGVVEEVGLRWVRLRSDLLDIAEHPAVQQRLRSGADVPRSQASRQIADAQRDVERDVAQVVVRTLDGGPVVTLEPPEGANLGSERVITTFVPVELGVYDVHTGVRLGTLHAQVRMSSLAPSGAGWVGVGGSVLGIFSSPTGAPLLPLAIDQAVFRQPRFTWANEPWISVRQVLSEPGLELVLAAPVTPFREPFATATREGTVALIVVALLSFALVTLLARRLTRSLARLAAAADAVAAGDLDQSVDAAGADEVARVGRAFNQMTESLKRTLRDLAQRESLAAVGEFAASLAHEVRNPLSAVRLDLQRAQERASEVTARELIDRALRSVERLDATVSGALRLARSGMVRRELVDLRTAVAGAIESASAAFGARRVEVEAPTGAGPVVVSGDAAQLEQLFLNLLLNAADAVQASGRAGVRIAADDRAVTAEVWDSGSGMPDDVLAEVFEPFVTSKANGTGLGLAIARRIVLAHGGSIRADSTPGKGTTIRVELPLARSAPGRSA
jgi:signal transduction histidine kinase